PTVGQVGHVRPAREREEVVLTEALEADVLHEDHLVILLGEVLLEVDPRVEVKPLEDLGVHPGHAVGRLAQALSIRVLSDCQQDPTPRRADSTKITAPLGEDGETAVVLIMGGNRPASTCAVIRWWAGGH